MCGVAQRLMPVPKIAKEMVRSACNFLCLLKRVIAKVEVGLHASSPWWILRSFVGKESQLIEVSSARGLSLLSRTMLK